MINKLIKIGDIVTIIFNGQLKQGIVCNINKDGEYRVSDNININEMKWSVWLDGDSMIKGSIQSIIEEGKLWTI